MLISRRIEVTNVEGEEPGVDLIYGLSRGPSLRLLSCVEHEFVPAKLAVDHWQNTENHDTKPPWKSMDVVTKVEARTVTETCHCGARREVTVEYTEESVKRVYA